MDGFTSRKGAILVALNSDTPDKSPKGYVDEPLLPLIVLINNHQDYVTTSSCSGRICTYLEGLDESAVAASPAEPLPQSQDDTEDREPSVNHGGKDEEAQVSQGYDENTSLAAVEAAKRAKGGQWLYVSHDPVVLPAEQTLDNQRWIVETLFGPEAHRVVLMEDRMDCAFSQQAHTLPTAQSQLIYFKFEPMILHIEAATPAAAKTFLNHSLFSGYRNSGILPSQKRTMLAIRSTLKIDAPIAYIPSAATTSSTRAETETKADPSIYLLVSLSYLRMLVELSNDKFRLNVAQMGRFERRLAEHLESDGDHSARKTGDRGEWEDKEVRRERKRKEGLVKQQQVTNAKVKVEDIQTITKESATFPNRDTQSLQ